MKPAFKHLAAALAALVSLPAVHAAVAEKSESKSQSESKSKSESKSELRVISSTPERRVLVERALKGEKETVAFLGVETGPVSATTGAQLGLPRGTGLVVNHVVPKSPAEGVLQPHDILLKLDDQILIETRQLAVLIRNKKQGDEVTITYLRAGQRSTAKVTLGQHEAPKLSWVGGEPRVFGLEAAPFALFTPFEEARRSPDQNREDTDHVLSLIERARVARDGSGQQPPVRIQIDRQGGPGFRAMSISTADSNLVFTDDAGSLELTQKDGVKSLVAKDTKGAELFSGPVTTPDERKALPAAVRERLEQLEGMHNMSFHTDRDFKGAETKVVRPLERSISFPRSAAPVRQRVTPLL